MKEELLIQKGKTQAEEEKEEFKGLYHLGKKKNDTKAIQTFLRNSYRTHTALNSLADRKASILIKFNSILISLLILFFKNIVEINPLAWISAIVFLITALVSLAFATLAARPSVTSTNKNEKDPEVLKKNLFFFGNFSHLPEDLYEESFSIMMKDDKIVWGNMARDLYNLGKILNQKFVHLKWSYDTFLWGLIITVVGFLLALVNSASLF